MHPAIAPRYQIGMEKRQIVRTAPQIPTPILDGLVGVQDGVCGSRPTIIGHRIEVRHVLGWMSNGSSAEQVAEQYGLTRAQVLACLLYAAEMMDPENQ